MVNVTHNTDYGRSLHQICLVLFIFLQQLFDDIYISGGRLGLTLKVNSEALVAFLGATLADICREDA